MKVEVVLREVGKATSSSPVVLSWVMPDEPLLYAKRLMEPLERNNGYFVGSRVHVTQDSAGNLLAINEAVIDPEKGADAVAIGAAIERSTGAELVELPSDVFIHADTRVGGQLLYPMGLWRPRTNPGGDLPPKPPAGQYAVAMGFEMVTPPARTFGVVARNLALQTLAGGLMRLGTYFPFTDERLLKALEDRPMNISSRIAWAFAAVGGNWHDLTVQLVTLPKSGRQRWVGEGVVCFQSALQVRAARGLLYGLSQIYDLTYPKPPNPDADPFDPSNTPPSRHDDPFDDLREQSIVY